MKKYKLDLTDSKIVNGKTVYRIIAIKDIIIDKKIVVKVGDKGGYVESENNLSHEGNCWIYDKAVVFDNAKLYDNAVMYDNSKMYENAVMYDDTILFDNVVVYGEAELSDEVCVYDNVKIYGNSIISGFVKIYDNAEIYGYAKIKDFVRIYDNAKICDKAYVLGRTKVCKNAVISEEQKIINGVVTKDLSKNLLESIRCQTGLGVFNNKIIAYKLVKKNLFSIFDKTFKYNIGKVSIAKEIEYSNRSCVGGLHFYNMNFTNKDIEDFTILIAEINLEDIITVQRGKIRCKKALILGKYNIED